MRGTHALLFALGCLGCADGPHANGRPPIPELQLDSVPLVVIGEREGPPEYLFSRIVGLELIGNGQIAVADDGVPVGRLYDRTGSFIRQLGREGEGPGEYRYIRGFWTSAPDRIHVLDASPSRITTFDPSGEVVRTTRYEIGSIRPYGVAPISWTPQH